MPYKDKEKQREYNKKHYLEKELGCFIKKTKIINECIYCHKKFEARDYRQISCSKECYIKHFYSLHQRILTKRKCLFCQKSFLPQKRNNTKCCSHNCDSKYYYNLHQKEILARLKKQHKSHHIKIIRTCPHCNKEFELLTRSDQIYCSKKCYMDNYLSLYKDEVNAKHRLSGRKYYEKHKEKLTKQHKEYANRLIYSPKKITCCCPVCNKTIYILPFTQKNNKQRLFFCSRKCWLEYNIKEKHYAWNGGSSFEPYGLAWTRQLRKTIRERDNYTCQLCNKHKTQLKKDLFIHHIDYVKTNSILSNFISLCNNCHSKTNTSNREIWIKYFQRILSEKYGYNYPQTIQEKLLMVGV